MPAPLKRGLSGDSLFWTARRRKAGSRQASVGAAGRLIVCSARQASVLWALVGDVLLAALRADGDRALAALDAVTEEKLRRAAPAQG
jgi:hypothetical protein